MFTASEQYPVSSTSDIETDKPISRLEDWRRFGKRLIGYIYQDPRFPEGHCVWTSTVLRMDNHYAVTRNTIYQLGKPLSI